MPARLRAMTISSETRKAGPYPGNGVAVSFPFTFKVFQAADLLVVRAQASTGAETVLTLGTDYTVTLNPNQDSAPGGTVTVPAPLASGFSITIGSAIKNLQPLELTDQGNFYPSVLAKALDRLTILVQQLGEQVGRSLKISFSSTTESTPDALLSALSTATTAASGSAQAAAGSAQTAAAAAALATAGVISGRLLGVRVFTTSNSGQTYAPTAGTASIVVQMVGGGGAGGATSAPGASQVALAGPGLSGAFAFSRFTSGFSGALITVGAGGVGAVGQNGTSGGTSSLGVLVTCPGGAGGAQGSSIASSTASASKGQASATVGFPSGANIFGLHAAAGRDTLYLATGGSLVGSGGSTPLGCPDLGFVAGSGFGYGGGGNIAINGDAARAGSPGGDGVVIIYEYA